MSFVQNYTKSKRQHLKQIYLILLPLYVFYAILTVDELVDLISLLEEKNLMCFILNASNKYLEKCVCWYKNLDCLSVLGIGISIKGMLQNHKVEK